jgi:hypothetical protein
MNEVLIISFGCLALHVCFVREGFPLHWSLPYVSKLPTIVQKPLFTCLPCMGSLYTAITFLMHDWGFDKEFLFTMFAVVGVNTLFDLFFRLIEAVENLEQFDK